MPGYAQERVNRKDNAMLRKTLTASILAASLIGAAIAASAPAEARYGRHGAYIGGTGFFGGPFYDDEDDNYEPYSRQCYIQRRFVRDHHGGHFARVHVCY